MLTLAVLMQLAGLIFTFTLGVAGYVVGPLTIVAGGVLYRHELRRRKTAASTVADVAQPTAPAPAPRRPGWQRFLIVVGSVVAAFAGVFALVWHLTSALAETADKFFLALKSGDVEQARTFLAEDFRAATSEAELANFVERSALARYESASWTSRSIENTSGYLAGTVTTEDGGSVPLQISLVREHGSWKILSLRKPEAGILSGDGQQPPSAAEQLRLARASTELFAEALTLKDFSRLHGEISQVWQQQITAAQLQAAFKPFLDQDADLTVLNSMEPRIRVAKFDDQGAFALEGTYPSQPNTVSFRYRYLYEGVDWKLIGLHVDIR
jgi:hypothetical protein